LHCQVAATDADAGDNARIRYVIPGDVTSMFHVDQRGVVSSRSSIDREQYHAFRFPVVAVDAGTPSRTGSAVVPTTDGTSHFWYFLSDLGTLTRGRGASGCPKMFVTVSARRRRRWNSVADRLDACGHHRRRRKRRTTSVHAGGLRVPSLGKRTARNQRNSSKIVISAVLCIRVCQLSRLQCATNCIV